MAQRRVSGSAAVTAEVRSNELARAEKDVLVREERLASELLEAQDRARAAAAALEGLRARVEGARAVTSGAAIATVARDVSGLATPALDLDDHRERELTVREDAVRARSWLASALAQDLALHRAEVEHLHGQIEAAERALAATLATAAADDAQADVGADATRRGQRETAPDLAAVGAAAAPRRQLPRVRMQTEIDLHSPSNFFTGFSENLSDGGVFVATDRDVPIGAEVELAFALPDGVEIRGRGIVRWSRDAGEGHEAGLGVQFVDLGGAAREAVERFLTARDPIFYPG